MRLRVRPELYRESISIGATPPYRPCSRRISIAYLFLVAAFGLLLAPTLATAQEPKTTYWEYSASGRLRDVQPVDIDGDGVDEFLVADENGRRSAGHGRWSGRLDVRNTRTHHVRSRPSYPMRRSLKNAGLHSPVSNGFSCWMGAVKRLASPNSNRTAEQRDDGQTATATPEIIIELHAL